MIIITKNVVKFELQIYLNCRRHKDSEKGPLVNDVVVESYQLLQPIIELVTTLWAKANFLLSSVNIVMFPDTHITKGFLKA